MWRHKVINDNYDELESDDEEEQNGILNRQIKESLSRIEDIERPLLKFDIGMI